MEKRLDLLTQTHDLLYILGVKATMMGFLETSCALYLLMQKPDNTWFSIMELYQQISELYHVDIDEIDPRIRRVIGKVWSKHRELLRRISGEELEQQPSPRQFLQMLRHYLYTRNNLI